MIMGFNVMTHAFIAAKYYVHMTEAFGVFPREGEWREAVSYLYLVDYNDKIIILFKNGQQLELNVSKKAIKNVPPTSKIAVVTNTILVLICAKWLSLSGCLCLKVRLNQLPM